MPETLLRVDVSVRAGGDCTSSSVLEHGPGPALSAVNPSWLPLSSADRSELRWYWEEGRDYASGPAAARAHRAERRLKDVGERLFAGLFGTNVDLASALAGDLDHLRVEIRATGAAAISVPWELLRHPERGTLLALSAREFVRISTTERAALAVWTAGPLRVLLVVSRPFFDEDVAVRSVAHPLLKTLAHSSAIEVSVLRPPTYEQLTAWLEAARQRGRPFHVVHFDGHGEYGDAVPDDGEPAPPASEMPPRGWLMFERPLPNLPPGTPLTLERSAHRVDGTTLGEALAAAGVPVVILNACQSAYAGAAPSSDLAVAAPSLADELLAAGIGAVVAMQYSVYVDSMAEFMRGLYAAIRDGASVTAAVSVARRRLAARDRSGVNRAETLDDWPVPAVFVAPFHPPWPDAGSDMHASVSEPTPPTPSSVLTGRDAVILALDRVFDASPVALLHGMAGGGKSRTARAFAEWYRDSGGATVPVLLTAITADSDVATVVEDGARQLAAVLEHAGYDPAGLDEHSRLAAMLDVLLDVRALWIWDGLDAIREDSSVRAGLARLLELLISSRVRVLLTSRHEEQEWLGTLASRLQLTALDSLATARLARSWLDDAAGGEAQPSTVRLFAEWSGGNPGALRAAIDIWRAGGSFTAESARGLIERLEAGADLAHDEAVTSGAAALHGTFGSMRARLGRGRAELAKPLGFLSLFQRGFTPVVATTFADAIGRAGLRNVVTANDAQRALRWCARRGLASAAGPMWQLHPLTPWILQPCFAGAFQKTADRIQRAWVDAIAMEAVLFEQQYRQGERGLEIALRLGAGNFARARALALLHGWQDRAIQATQALVTLRRDIEGDREAAAELILELARIIIDDATARPKAGQEEGYPVVAGWQAVLFHDSGNRREAVRVQQAAVVWLREQTSAAADVPLETLSPDERRHLRWLATGLSSLGTYQRLDAPAGAIASMSEARRLLERFGARLELAVLLVNLALVKLDQPEPDLDEAEQLLRESYDLRAGNDAIGHARCLIHLATVFHRRSMQTVSARGPDADQQEVLRRSLDEMQTATSHLERAITLLPPVSSEDRVMAHTNAGLQYAMRHAIDEDPDTLERSLRHLLAALQSSDALGLDHTSAQIALKAAQQLETFGQPQVARDYAESAMARFAALGSAGIEGQITTLKWMTELAGRADA